MEQYIYIYIYSVYIFLLVLTIGIQYFREVRHLTSFKSFSCWVVVAHACNPSYLEGRDQEDCSSKPAQAYSSRDPILKIPITKKGQ
jgi:hypothetical protein